MPRTRSNALMTLVVSIVLVMTGCSASTGSTDDGTLKIALLMPTTGPAASLGTTYAATAEHLVEELNSSGGVRIGEEDYQIVIDVFDDGNTAEEGQKVVREVLDDGYEFIWGPFGSAPTSAIVSPIQQAEAFWLVNAVVAGPTTYERAFRTSPLAEFVEAQFLRMLEDDPSIQRVAITTDRQFTGVTERTDDFIAEIEALGREVVASEEHQAGDSDMRPIITTMRAQEPDVYLLRGYPSEVPTFVGQTRELAGHEALIAVQNVLTQEDTASVFPDDSVLDNTVVVSVPTGLEQFVAAGDEQAIALSEALGDEQGTYSAWAHDAFQILVAGLSAAEEPTPDALATAMAALQASEVEDLTLNNFQAQDDGRLFGPDREIQMTGATMVWANEGWVFRPST